MTTDVGLRERRRLRTRAALHDAAVRLATDRGWDATTVADIAAAAEVAPRTFFSYFEVKEAVLFAPYEDAFAAFERVMAERPNGGTALEELRTWLVAEIVEGPGLSPAADALMDRLFAESAVVNMYGLTLLDRLEHHLARAIATDLGVGGDDPLPAIAAAATAAALYRATVAPATGPDDRERQLAVFDTAMAFARAGLAATHPPSGGTGSPRAAR